MEIAYGHRIIADNDPYLQMVNHGTQVVADSGNLGVNILDIFPICADLSSLTVQFVSPVFSFSEKPPCLVPGRMVHLVRNR